MEGGRHNRDFIEDLVARLQAAHEQSAQERERAEVLGEFVRAFRDEPDRLLLRCAWCGKIELNGRFVDVEQYLSADVPARIRERTTHGICPDCLKRVADESALQRRR